MLRWREEELHQTKSEWPIWRLVCMILNNAIRKNASIVFVKKTAVDKCVVLYAIDGAIHQEMTLPVKLARIVVGQLMTFGGPLDAVPGARSQFEVVRNDGTVLTGHLLMGENELGLTATCRLTPPKRVLN